eukprot:scaffold731_cov261-Pinguiococcus_pyrenoidosus.AAC.114
MRGRASPPPPRLTRSASALRHERRQKDFCSGHPEHARGPGGLRAAASRVQPAEHRDQGLPRCVRAVPASPGLPVRPDESAVLPGGAQSSVLVPPDGFQQPGAVAAVAGKQWRSPSVVQLPGHHGGRKLHGGHGRSRGRTVPEPGPSGFHGSVHARRAGPAPAGAAAGPAAAADSAAADRAAGAASAPVVPAAAAAGPTADLRAARGPCREPSRGQAHESPASPGPIRSTRQRTELGDDVRRQRSGDPLGHASDDHADVARRARCRPGRGASHGSHEQGVAGQRAERGRARPAWAGVPELRVQHGDECAVCQRLHEPHDGDRVLRQPERRPEPAGGFGAAVPGSCGHEPLRRAGSQSILHAVRPRQRVSLQHGVHHGGPGGGASRGRRPRRERRPKELSVSVALAARVFP